MNTGNNRIAGILVNLLVVGLVAQNLAVAGNPPLQPTTRLINFSARANSGVGANELIAGFATRGDSYSTPKYILVRGMGPSLGQFGVQGALQDPFLTFNVIAGANPQYLATDAGWSNQPVVRIPVDDIALTEWETVTFQSATAAMMSEIGAFVPISSLSADSALVAIVPPGGFTAGIDGADGGSGVALAEIYDADGAMGFPANTARLVNLSARANVGTGANALIAGFVISGLSTETILVRGMGPSLAPMGVTGALLSPVLTVYDASGLVIATNAGWSSAPVPGQSPVVAGLLQASSAIFATAGAFQPMSASSADSAMVVTLPAGAYTVAVTGAGIATGVALVELYEIQAQ